jgi:fructosamine-3-kinase
MGKVRLQNFRKYTIARVNMFNIPEIESFISSKIGQKWQSTAHPEDSSGRRMAYIVRGNPFAVFIKPITGSDAFRKAECEKQGLHKLSQVEGVRTPNVIGVLETREYSALIMEAINRVQTGTVDWSRLGEMIAALHNASWTHFGLEYNNFIGDFPQDNTPEISWNNFYLNRRAIPMLKRAVDAGHLALNESSQIELVLQKIDSISNMNDVPSLLHGDLWHGNVIFLILTDLVDELATRDIAVHRASN